MCVCMHLCMCVYACVDACMNVYVHTSLAAEQVITLVARAAAWHLGLCCALQCPHMVMGNSAQI